MPENAKVIPITDSSPLPAIRHFTSKFVDIEIVHKEGPDVVIRVHDRYLGARRLHVINTCFGVGEWYDGLWPVDLPEYEGTWESFEQWFNENVCD